MTERMSRIKEEESYIRTLINFKKSLDYLQIHDIGFDSSNAYDLLEIIDVIHWKNANDGFITELLEGLETIVYSLQRELSDRGI